MLRAYETYTSSPLLQSTFFDFSIWQHQEHHPQHDLLPRQPMLDTYSMLRLVLYFRSMVDFRQIFESRRDNLFSCSCYPEQQQQSTRVRSNLVSYHIAEDSKVMVLMQSYKCLYPESLQPIYLPLEYSLSVSNLEEGRAKLYTPTRHLRLGCWVLDAT